MIAALILSCVFHAPTDYVIEVPVAVVVSVEAAELQPVRNTLRRGGAGGLRRLATRKPVRRLFRERSVFRFRSVRRVERAAMRAN
jgi:hypothetical protein